MNKLGLIAGSGDLPLILADHCRETGTELFCVWVRPFGCNRDYPPVANSIEVDIGYVGEAISFLKKNGVNDLVFVGGVKKPSFSFLKVDVSGLSLVRNILKNKLLGDNSILETVAEFFRKQGFRILEIDSILDNLKLNVGFNNKIKCAKEYLEDIDIGYSVLKKLSELDLGQSVVIQQKNVMGIECAEGTANLIERTGKLKYPTGNKPILIKIKKTNQTRKIDLPAIGPNTIDQLQEAGFAGIAVDCENCLVISKETVIEKATRSKIFVYGLN
jgi:DUF1009 family protein